MNIETDEWITAGEASRLLGVSQERIRAMGNEDGSLERISPWPRVSLISRASVEDRLAGVRQVRIGPPQARRWALKRMGIETLGNADIDELRDVLLDFIMESRPRWAKVRQDLWALDMASRLWRAATTTP